MPDIAQIVAEQMLPMVITAIGTAVGATLRSVCKAIRKAKKDLNCAHMKIRELENRIYDLEDICRDF